jgi:outer membrane protein OmpA-like peptidoglycan-associated protein
MKPLLTIGLTAGVLVYGQQTIPNPTQRQEPAAVQLEPTPIFRVNVVARDIRAVNYLHRGGSTKVDFSGTAIMPQAKGSAKVESERGVIRVSAEFKDLAQPSSFGSEYLTYVLWAVSPDGRPVNLGELTLDSYGAGSSSKIDTTSDIQTFGLIVTAEPYYAVTQPSDAVVMENIIRPDTRGVIESVNAHYELLPRGSYTMHGKAPGYVAVVVGKKNPFELYEAENAVELARVAGAPKYAAESFQKAEAALQQAEKYQAQHPGQKPVITMAREAAVRAEDARVVALKREQQEQLDNERAAALARENAEKARAEQAKLQADAEAKQRAEAEAQRAKAEADRAAAEKSKTEALAAVAQAETARQAALREKADADAARQAAIQQQQQLARETEKAQQAAAQAEALRQKAEQDQIQLRKQLLEQFSLILQTRDTARGLIVNMSDVLFDTGQYTLRPGAREKLAKVAGIILSHPGLKIKVEGHTDSVGGDEYNMKLSENRAGAVRAYLVGQGIDPGIVTAEGFGKTRPVADNSTAAGRQANRRVEMVVSGDIIGSPIGQLSTAPQERAQN